MIEEDYVNFETAKLLKGKGFDEDIDLWYDENGETFFELKYDIGSNWRVRNNQNVYECPTLQMAMKWLREKHHIVIDVCFENHIFEADDSITMTFSYTIWRFNKKWPYGGYATIDGEEKNSYEEASESAIKYVLENLI